MARDNAEECSHGLGPFDPKSNEVTENLERNKEERVPLVIDDLDDEISPIIDCMDMMRVTADKSLMKELDVVRITHNLMTDQCQKVTYPLDEQVLCSLLISVKGSSKSH